MDQWVEFTLRASTPKVVAVDRTRVVTVQHDVDNGNVDLRLVDGSFLSVQGVYADVLNILNVRV